MIPPYISEDMKKYMERTSHDISTFNPFVKPVRAIKHPEQYRAAGIDIWRSCYDAELPANLLEMCHPEKCDLCGVPFSKPIVAKTHYVGKIHCQKTAKFLEVWSNMAKQRVPSKISEFNTSMHDVIPSGMRVDWCPVCQLHLSSQIVAISHYKGQRHRKALARVGSLSTVSNGNIGVTPGETDENKLVIVEDVPEKTAQEQTPQIHRFYCLPCKRNFLESEDYTKHMSS